MPRTALPFVLLVLVLSAGCLGSSEPAVREERAVDALAAAREAAATVETYRFDLTVEATTRDSSRRYTADGSGRVNVTAHRMALTTNARGRSFESYVDGRTAYEQCPPNGAFWAERNVTAENWTSVTPLGRQLVFLSTGDLYYNGTETIDGDEVVHLSGRPSLSALRQRTDLGATSLPDASKVDSLSIHAWLDAETSRLQRSRFSVTASEDGESATATLRITFRDYGSPAVVSVPAEARDAFHDGGCPS